MYLHLQIVHQTTLTWSRTESMCPIRFVRHFLFLRSLVGVHGSCGGVWRAATLCRGAAEENKEVTVEKARWHTERQAEDSDPAVEYKVELVLVSRPDSCLRLPLRDDICESIATPTLADESKLVGKGSQFSAMHALAPIPNPNWRIGLQAFVTFVLCWMICANYLKKTYFVLDIGGRLGKLQHLSSLCSPLRSVFPCGPAFLGAKERPFRSPYTAAGMLSDVVIQSFYI